MKPQTIWRLDRWIGRPACAVLTLVNGLFRLFAPPRRQPPRRILFVKLIEMGSTVLACPAFHEATRMVGRDNLFILVFAPNRAIADVLPYFRPENVLTIDDSSLSAFALGLVRALARIRREGIDTAIDMEGLTRSSAIITWLTGARTRVGYHNFTSEGPYRGRLFTHELNYNFQHHISGMFYALVRAAAADPAVRPIAKELIPETLPALPQITPYPGEEDALRQIINARAGRPVTGPLVLLNPNCSDLLPLRRWPDEHFIQLGKRLLESDPALTLALTGAPAEKEGAERLAALIGPPDRVVSLAGHTTLRQLFVLYTMARLLISNDSGPCHFAGLTPIRVIALFGPETPLLYSPIGPRVDCLTSGFACSPCVNILNHRFSPCTDNRCMSAITVDRVYRLARERLQT